MEAASMTLIPKPVEVKPGSGAFRITEETTIAYQPACKGEAEYLADYLRPAVKLELHQRSSAQDLGGQGNVIALAVADGNGAAPAEGYKLDIAASGIAIVGNDPAGCFRGIQTLRQLLPPALDAAVVPRDLALELPVVAITDHPRFRWRGFMLDECRHFFGKVLAKRMIDIIALYKFNKLHWHLTEDEGWRIESKRFPRLHEVASKR
ncbi:MAG: family 20 glycosylhydrolase, partial [Candidatus Lokiarchaeota archaeon]|nr:family 20 glycosylhydrolase [Candidatus Lokiarchaeota archaeon]